MSEEDGNNPEEQTSGSSPLQGRRARLFMAQNPETAAAIRSALVAQASGSSPPESEEAARAAAQNAINEMFPRDRKPNTITPPNGGSKYRPPIALTTNPSGFSPVNRNASAPLGYTPQKLTPAADDPLYQQTLNNLRAQYPTPSEQAAAREAAATPSTSEENASVTPTSKRSSTTPSAEIKEEAPDLLYGNEHFGAAIVFKHFNDKCRTLSKRNLFGTDFAKMARHLDANLESMDKKLPDMAGLLVEKESLARDAKSAVEKVFSRHSKELRTLYKKSNHHNGVFLQKNNGAAFEGRLAEVFAECYQETLEQYSRHAARAKSLHSDTTSSRTLSGDIRDLGTQASERVEAGKSFVGRHPAKLAWLATAAAGIGSFFVGSEPFRPKPEPQAIHVSSAVPQQPPVVIPSAAPPVVPEIPVEESAKNDRSATPEPHPAKPHKVEPPAVRAEVKPEAPAIPEESVLTASSNRSITDSPTEPVNTVTNAELSPTAASAVQPEATNEIGKRYLDRLIQSGKLRLLPSFFTREKPPEAKQTFTTLFPEGVSPAVDAIRNMKPTEVSNERLEPPIRKPVDEAMPLPKPPESVSPEMVPEKQEAPVEVASTKNPASTEPTYYQGAGGKIQSLGLNENQTSGVLANASGEPAISPEIGQQAKAVFYGNSGIQSLGLNENQNKGVLATASPGAERDSPTTYGSSGLLSLGLNGNQETGVLKPTQTPSFTSRLKGSVSRFFGR